MKTVVSLEQWRRRDNLVKQAVTAGWNVKPGDLADLDDPVAFYLSEPLQTQFKAISMFRFSDLADFVKNGTDRFATRQEISDSTAAITTEVLDADHPVEPDNLRYLMFAHFINYSATKTAKIVVDSREPYRHIGAVVYRNPNRTDGVTLTVRPIALSNSESSLEPGVVAMAVLQTMLQDYDNHPEYFVGVDLDEVFAKLMSPYPEVLR
ncbi:MAG: hypothetical protein CVV05_01580 [Gammaproteobacteria bacterium HGW-Gammaproteobacteria-1]|jgi:hypothetical protein|nr:MAG: hypothetical protein CVV05_01580 [Gammaproteobacteria bacterium HGW-Gammaproteobacteria-1]